MFLHVVVVAILVNPAGGSSHGSILIITLEVLVAAAAVVLLLFVCFVCSGLPRRGRCEQGRARSREGLFVGECCHFIGSSRGSGSASQTVSTSETRTL